MENRIYQNTSLESLLHHTPAQINTYWTAPSISYFPEGSNGQHWCLVKKKKKKKSGRGEEEDKEKMSKLMQICIPLWAVGWTTQNLRHQCNLTFSNKEKWLWVVVPPPSDLVPYRLLIMFARFCERRYDLLSTQLIMYTPDDKLRLSRIRDQGRFENKPQIPSMLQWGRK